MDAVIYAIYNNLLCKTAQGNILNEEEYLLYTTIARAIACEMRLFELYASRELNNNDGSRSENTESPES